MKHQNFHGPYELPGMDGINTIPIYDTIAAVQAAFVDPRLPLLAVAGYTARGDAPVAWYLRSATEPTHPGKVRSHDGAWWVIQGPQIYPEQFGATADGVTDDLPAIQDAEECRLACDYELVFSDTYYLDNPNAWEVTRPRWQGKTNASSVLVMDGASSICIWLKGAGGFSCGYMRDLVFWAPASRTTGQALRLDGDATYQPDEFTSTNLKITGAGTWDIPLMHFGTDRTSPQGLRGVTHYNLFIGKDISAGVYGENCVQLQIFGGGIYGGTTNALQLAGDIGASTNCADCIINGFKINGNLNVDDTITSVFNIVVGSVTLGADADNNTVMGYNSGATTNNGSGNNVAALG